MWTSGIPITPPPTTQELSLSQRPKEGRAQALPTAGPHEPLPVHCTVRPRARFKTSGCPSQTPHPPTLPVTGWQVAQLRAPAQYLCRPRSSSARRSKVTTDNSCRNQESSWTSSILMASAFIHTNYSKLVSNALEATLQSYEQDPKTVQEGRRPRQGRPRPPQALGSASSTGRSLTERAKIRYQERTEQPRLGPTPSHHTQPHGNA